jgi:hypothetical protein
VGNSSIFIFAAIIGGVVAHLLSKKRDQDSKRRELVVENKIALWKSIDQQNSEAALSHGGPLPDPAVWERIAQDIQLFGTDEQINMVREVTRRISSRQDVSLVDLQKSLLTDLRAELGLPAPSAEYFWVRSNSAMQQNIKSEPRQ